MGVSDIIGTDPAGDVTTTNSTNGTAQFKQRYNGADPELSKLLFGVWANLNILVGFFILVFKWNIDNDNTNVSLYEKMFRVAGLTLILPYLPAAIFWPIIIFLHNDSITITYRYYLASYFSLGGPLLGFFGIEILYIQCLVEGNDSGLYIANYWTYFFHLLHTITIQLISLMI